ncbi:hypothetical protein Tco_0687243 [Tanacetum coccineum]
MSMLEDRPSYNNVSESAQDTNGEVNLTHAYYNGSKTSKDNEDPSWSTSINIRRQRRHLQQLEALWMSFYYVVFILVRNIHSKSGLPLFQQTKLDLELVPKEKRLDIGKCNGRPHPGKIQESPRFQFGQDFDALPTDEEIVSFLRDLGHTREIHLLNDVVVEQMHQPWRTFAALINRSLSGKTSGLEKLRLSRAQILWAMYHQKNMDYVKLLWEDFIYQIDHKAYKKQEKMYYPRFSKVIIHYFFSQDKTLSWRNKIGMHTYRDDYLINTLRFVSAKEETQIYGAILPESLTSPEMKETKAYKTYFVSTEESMGKSKRVKRPAKKSTKAPARGVVIRETPEMPLSKKKEKVDVSRGKGIELLSETHPSGSGIVTKTTPSFAKIKPSVTSEGASVKPGVPNVTEEESSESEAES